jgi:hypothetical protein
VSSSSGAQLTFRNIAVAGESTIVADSAADTVTFVAGNNVNLSTDPATDSLTISVNAFDNIDGGTADSVYGGTNGIDGGAP